MSTLTAEQNTVEQMPLDLSAFPIDDKGRIVVPDEIMETRTKELPNGTINESGTYRAYNGGRLYQIGSNPDKDKEITTAGANASNTTQAQRRTFREDTLALMKTKAPQELAEAQGLAKGASVQEVALAALGKRAMQGDRGALEFLRDTAGEKPADRQEIEANVMTEADRQLIETVRRRQEQEREATRYRVNPEVETVNPLDTETENG